MTSCTIIISHYESLPFLRACIRQIRKHEHSEIEQKIIIAEQSCKETYDLIVSEYGKDDDIKIEWIKPLYSGYGIDFCIRHSNIQTDYISQVHVDAFPVSNKWLYLPIKLIEEYDFAFVGQLQFIADGKASIYPPNPFFAMAQCYNVARTKTYVEMSFEAGFTRFHQRTNAGIVTENNDWQKWAKDDYWRRGSDDDVVAFHWQDKYREVSKLGLAISGYVEPNFARLIDDLVFHFGSAREAIGVMDSMPERYKYYTQKIQENYSDELIEEMVSLAKLNTPPNMEILTRNVWNGVLKKSFPSSPELDKRIEELKL